MLRVGAAESDKLLKQIADVNSFITLVWEMSGEGQQVDTFYRL